MILFTAGLPAALGAVNLYSNGAPLWVVGIPAGAALSCAYSFLVRESGNLSQTTMASTTKILAAGETRPGGCLGAVFGKAHDGDYEPHYKRAAPLFVFDSIRGVELPCPVEDNRLLDFCQTACRLWDNWLKQQDNARKKSINQVLSSRNWVRDSRWHKYTPAQVKACKKILVASGYMFDFPGKSGRRAGRLTSTHPAPAVMVRRAKYVWGYKGHE